MNSSYSSAGSSAHSFWNDDSRGSYGTFFKVFTYNPVESSGIASYAVTVSSAGSQQYMSNSDGDLLPLLDDDLVISCWYRWDGGTSRPQKIALFSSGDDSAGLDVDWEIGLYLSSGDNYTLYYKYVIYDAYLDQYSDVTEFGEILFDITEGGWHHVFFYREGATFDLYHDSSTVFDTPATMNTGWVLSVPAKAMIAPNDDAVSLDEYAFWSAPVWDGYSYAQTAQALYNQSWGKFYHSTPMPLGMSNIGAWSNMQNIGAYQTVGYG